MNVTYRRISIVLGIALLVGGYFLKNELANSKEPPKRKGKTEQKRLVKAQTATNNSIQVNINITGKLVAKNRIEVFAEVAGKLLETPKDFKTGVQFEKGESLIVIDDREFRLNLLAAKSNFLSVLTQVLPDIKLDYQSAFGDWKNYVDHFELEENLSPLPEVESPKLKSFLVSKNVYNTYYQLKSQEERLGKYRIMAPFTGVISQALINHGTLVRMNQKLGEFIRPGHYEMEAAINVKDLSFIAVGDSVKLTSDDISGTWYGRIARISNNINPSTQTFSVFVNVQSNDLKEGMFLNGAIKGDAVENVIQLDRRLLVDQTFVYAIEDSALAKKQVEIKKYTPNTVLVSGLPDSIQLLKQPVTGAYEGMPVTPIEE